MWRALITAEGGLRIDSAVRQTRRQFNDQWGCWLLLSDLSNGGDATQPPRLIFRAISNSPRASHVIRSKVRAAAHAYDELILHRAAIGPRDRVTDRLIMAELVQGNSHKVLRCFHIF
ncbi:hypothetical protein C2W62_16660 [Candidatus Entotheonella serta]|nr:hypothetical protein C2W62_16660 [Candidatus Entotheonella serta]